MITDAHLGIAPGTRVILLAQAAQEDEPALPEQRATYLGEGLFVIDKADRLDGDYDGFVEVSDPDQFRTEDNASVTCPSQHPVGRQNPLYEGTTATGWFECEVCRLQYCPLLAPPLQWRPTCDKDGVTEDSFGSGHYWHCEEVAVYLVRMPENHPEGVISGTTEMRLCLDHLEEVIFE